MRICAGCANGNEATAFTDPENEDKLQHSIAELAKGKTLLVIAHRLSTIRNADNIVVLKEGNIIAQGKQEELLSTCPLYRQMWEAHIGARDWAVSVNGSPLEGHGNCYAAKERKGERRHV